MKKAMLALLALSLGSMAAVYALSFWLPAPAIHLTGDHDLARSNKKICVLGDTGQPGPVLDAVLRGVVQENCSQLRILGDLVYPSGIDANDQRAVEAHFLTPFRGLVGNIPIYLLQGNHDFKEEHGNSWLEIAGGLDNVFYPYFYYSERWGNVCFFSLETTFNDKLYYPIKRLQQTRWLAQRYSRDAGHCGFSIVYAHHPYRSSGKHGPAVPQLKLFLDKWVIGRVDLQIGGHEHILSDEGQINGTRLSVVGSSSKAGAVHEQSWEAPFASSTPGFISLTFHSVGQDIFCKIKLVSVALDASGQLKIHDVWHQQIKGRGIRI